MAHSAETIGLASWVLLSHLLAELEGSHPGIHARTMQRVNGALANDTGVNAAAIRAVFAEVR